MKKDMQDEINVQLLDYCESLKSENKELSMRLDLLLEILTEVAKKIAK